MLSSASAEAVVIPFPAVGLYQNRLNTKDRIEILAWAEEARVYGYDRVVVRERHPQDDPQIGDFLAIYRTDEKWAAWGVARNGASLRVWRCGSGADLGVFDNIEAALAAILAASPTPEAPLRRRPA